MLYNHTRWLEALNFVFRKKTDCTIYVAKKKALISFAVTAKLICVFFAYAKSQFSYDTAHLMYEKDKLKVGHLKLVKNVCSTVHHRLCDHYDLQPYS